jgi:hypothetical protein
VFRAAADAMKFNGPAPELINGRLAMIGILAAAKQEIDTGATVLQQALQASPWLYAVLGLWVYASLVPILKGVRHEAFGEFDQSLQDALQLQQHLSRKNARMVACCCSLRCAVVLRLRVCAPLVSACNVCGMRHIVSHYILQDAV